MSLRIALLVDPLSAHAPNASRVRAAGHAHELARALGAREHDTRVFGLAGTAKHQIPGLATFRPDAVLAYDALSPAAWLGSRLARRLRVPLVLVEAGSFAEGSWMERTAWKLGKVLWGTFVRRIASALVALDCVARDQALREGFRAERVALLPHGVDVRDFRPGLVSPLVSEHRIRGRILMHPGPLDPRSGAELLVAAFARAVGQREDWSLVFLADGRSGARVRACADRLGVGTLVHVLEPREEDLPALYSSSTLVALPALDDAPVGSAVARAFASGRPVLASDLPRLRHLVEPAGAGRFARAGDVDDWARVVREAAGAPEARRRWSAAARAAAEARLDWRTLGAEVERLIESAQRTIPPRRERRGLGLARPLDAAADAQAVERAG